MCSTSTGDGSANDARELAVAAFDLVILLARDARVAAALQRDAPVVHLDAHLFARYTRQLGGHDERVGGLAQIDGRRPALGAGRGQPLEPMLNRQQVAERIPACKGHGNDGSTRPGGPVGAGSAGEPHAESRVV